MVQLTSSIFVLALAALAKAASRTTPPSGCIVVSKNASSGQFSTLQAAVNSLSTTSSENQCIFIYPGTYNEQVHVTPRTAQLTIYGSTTDTTTYTSNTVTITQGKSQDDSASNDLTATLRAWAANMKVYNINLVNTRGSGSQAMALSAQADKQGYYGVKLVGFQDTLLTNIGYQVYARSYIDGAVDFIFGQRSRVWFEKIDIRIKAAGCITANGRDSESNVSYYIFNNCNVAVASGSSVASGGTYLGRPWRDYSRVVFQNTALSAVVNPAGWRVWTDQDTNTDHVYYREFGNSGPGASGTRSFGQFLSAAEPITTLFGSDYASWIDTSYL
ncbi:pectinesterase-like protein [Choiromyces venosus 120613-1]|uniref:Pectinesterase n=1 Tax=Choiromyces venosus 120613-1 TaxID=1336337 RepID=A0A3N4JT01_9PEZI|nr:pectinesterase-like protein [Choiromyces venosus 120613-1]